MKFLSLFLVSLLLWGEATRNELEKIEPDAIVIGYGLNRVYAFVDPLCPNSKDFIDAIQSNAKVQKENTYFIFLHHLYMFNSENIINAIYEAKNQKQALIDVMVSNLPIEQKDANNEILKKRKRIQSVAMKTQMQQRPYLILFPFGSKYCKVSEGKAACVLQSSQ